MSTNPSKKTTTRTRTPSRPMSEFGDADPEDAWDDGDPVDAKVKLLERVVRSLRAEADAERARRRRADALRLLGKLEIKFDDVDHRIESLHDELSRIG
jgi:hypothetical protein